ncbi:hypothetical protein F511_11269 [Dorcoceras hygrometricum]|uniref:Uncharacterized protein n=1 Tax=Dorcoceras hygrometricum TaxID=472368 RepID=A0A2Z7CCZ0_9LAMI|nr:hypothetical protein F511_11269 [Dorcoceras hygrometricum]
MRIRPPEFETSICDAKYHVSIGREHCDVLSMQIDSDLVIYRTTLVRTFQVVTICRVDKSESTRSVLGKCVYLVTLAMSLFDLQDVCIAIGSIATIDLPMVVDLIGIYGLKGPYCTLTTTDWFLQALSVIPRGSWGDVARRFTMIRWTAHAASLPSLTPPPCAAVAAAVFAGKLVSGQLDVENPFVLISSGLLVQSDEGVSDLVVDRIGVDFASVLVMEHTGMARMFKTLADTGLKGFLSGSGSVYESAVVEFYANAMVVVGTIISSVANRKLALTKKAFVELFSGSDVLFTAPSKKKEMKMEFRLLHDVVAKAVCAKAWSFAMVTSEKFDLMVSITSGSKVNWAQILFQLLVVMVNNPARQSQGFAIQMSVLLERLVKADLGEVVKLHPQKVLNNKSVHTYIKKNLNFCPAGETSKVSGATANEHQLTADSIPSNKAEREADKQKKAEKAVVEKPKKKKEKVKKGEKLNSAAGGPEGHVGTTTENEEQVDNVDRIEQEESSNQTEKEVSTNEGAIVVRSGPEQPAQQSMTFTGKGIFTPMEIREINCVTHFLPKIDLAAKGKCQDSC